MKRILKFLFYLPMCLVDGIYLAWILTKFPFWPYDWEFTIQGKPKYSWTLFGKDLLKK